MCGAPGDSFAYGFTHLSSVVIPNPFLPCHSESLLPVIPTGAKRSGGTLRATWPTFALTQPTLAHSCDFLQEPALSSSKVWAPRPHAGEVLISSDQDIRCRQHQCPRVENRDEWGSPFIIIISRRSKSKDGQPASIVRKMRILPEQEEDGLISLSRLTVLFYTPGNAHPGKILHLPRAL